MVCLETEAFYELLDEVLIHFGNKKEDAELWVDSEQAMCILKISSKTTLQKYRDQGLIRFSQPSRKLVLYHKPSLYEFLDKNVTNF